MQQSSAAPVFQKRGLPDIQRLFHDREIMVATYRRLHRKKVDISKVLPDSISEEKKSTTESPKIT